MKTDCETNSEIANQTQFGTKPASTDSNFERVTTASKGVLNLMRGQAVLALLPQCNFSP